MLKLLPKFDYLRPENFEEAVNLLIKYRGRIRPFAGGTDFFVAMTQKRVTYKAVLDLKGINGYEFIREANGNIEIGALASIRSIEKSTLIRDKYPFLSGAAEKIGSVQVRNRATIGGNICNASPAADTVPSLICLRTNVEIVGGDGTRIIPLEDFFLSPGQTVLGPSELMRKIIIPELPDLSSGVYLKYSPRKAMDIAVVGVGCVLTLDSRKKKCIDSRITLGAVAPIPLRAKRAESFIRGKELTEKEIEEAGKLASQEAKPITDARGSAESRAGIVRIIVRNCISEVLRLIRT